WATTTPPPAATTCLVCSLLALEARSASSGRAAGGAEAVRLVAPRTARPATSRLRLVHRRSFGVPGVARFWRTERPAGADAAGEQFRLREAEPGPLVASHPGEHPGRPGEECGGSPSGGTRWLPPPSGR